MTKEEVEQYRRRFEAFHEWEAHQPPVERSPAAILADLGFLLSLVSPEERLRDPDPQKLGIQRMRAMLEKVSAWRAAHPVERQ
jgi:hypothetical protein